MTRWRQFYASLNLRLGHRNTFVFGSFGCQVTEETQPKTGAQFFFSGIDNKGTVYLFLLHVVDHIRR
jgi:hypothetical protein